MEYMKVSEAARKWGISPRRIRVLCRDKRIPGVTRNGNLYMIPADARKPEDGRVSEATKRQALLQMLSQVDDRLSALQQCRPLTAGEAERLHGEFAVEFTYNSNAIEGNTLTLKETARVLEGITIDQKPLKDHLEAIGHRDAFLYIEDVAKKELPLSESVIKNIHSLVLMDRPEDKGVFRRIPVSIVGAYTEPVQPYQIEPMLTKLLAENENRRKTMHVIERIARFHLEFEGIHPFIDGNGRTGRLILNLDMIRNGFPPVNVKFSDRRRYYDAFDAYYRDGNADVMTELLAEYVLERLNEYLRVLK